MQSTSLEQKKRDVLLAFGSVLAGAMLFFVVFAAAFNGDRGLALAATVGLFVAAVTLGRQRVGIVLVGLLTMPTILGSFLLFAATLRETGFSGAWQWLAVAGAGQLVTTLGAVLGAVMRRFGSRPLGPRP